MERGIDFLTLGARSAPGGAALMDGRSTWSYLALDGLVTERARALVAGGVAPGDVLAVTVSPDVASVVAIHAVRRAGAVLLPLNSDWTPTEMEAAVRMGGATRVLTPREWLPASGTPPLPGPGDLPEIAAVVRTSGSGGRPRGVELTARGLLHIARASAARLSLGQGDRWYASLQPAHVGGLALVLRAAALGSTVVAMGGFAAGELADLVAVRGVTHASLVPVMLQGLLDELAARGVRGTGLGAVLVGGAHTPPEWVRRAAAAGVPVALTWGMTEASSQVATATPDQSIGNPEAVGRPLEGVEVRTSESGELLVRGPTLARRYVGVDDPIMDPAGWFHTGDLGRLDAAGNVYVTGRASTRIVTGGLTVDPAEVERVIRRLEGVADCVVVGVPDPRWGERIAAAVVPEAGRELDLERIDRDQRTTLSAGRRVRSWTVLDALPLNSSGKVDREAVRAGFGDPGRGADAP